MEAATSRSIRIGKSSIGLVGLDNALNQATAKNLSEPDAAEFLYNEIAGKNYIPTGMEKQYRKALLDEFRKASLGKKDTAEHLIIRVFGSSCISCNQLQVMIIEVMDSMKIAADIEQIFEPDEIGRHGVMRTPALMINGELKISGMMPSLAQVKQWIREAQS